MKQNETIKIIEINECVKIALIPRKTIIIYINIIFEKIVALSGRIGLIRFFNRTYSRKNISNERIVAMFVGQNSYMIALNPKEELSNKNIPKMAILRFLKILIKIL